MIYNRKGFTLIEIIAVVIIIGIIFTIAVPMVSSYILDSRKTSYYGTISAYVETIKSEYDMMEFGDYLDDSEIMIVPISLIKLESGDSDSTPFGYYDYNKSYVVITSSIYTNQYYANFLDDANYGVSNLNIDSISKGSITSINSNDIMGLNSFISCFDNKYTLNNTIYDFNGKEYTACDYRMYKKENAEEFELMEKQENYEKESVPKVIKRILSVSIPITLSSLMSSINKNVDSITVVRNLKTFMSEAEAKIQYGILVGKVDILIGLPLSFNIAFQIALVPAIAAALAKKDYDTINKRVSFSMLITMLIGFPCTIGMIVFASPILELLFSNGTTGVLLLQISALTIFFTVLVQTMNGVLQGIGKVMVPAKAFAVGVLAKFIFNMIFIRIPMFGANAAAAGSVLCHVIIFTIEFMVIKKAIGFKFEFKKYILKPALATIGMAIVSYGIYALMNIFLASIIPSKVITVIALLIAVVTYAILVLLLKVISSEEMLMIPYGNKINQFVAKFAR